jgi:hypothetical protein
VNLSFFKYIHYYLSFQVAVFAIKMANVSVPSSIRDKIGYVAVSYSVRNKNADIPEAKNL